MGSSQDLPPSATAATPKSAAPTHTPGPWEVHHELIDGVETHIRAPIAGHPGDYWWIAGMCGGMLGDWDQANPHLIAAAPDLYRLSRWALVILDGEYGEFGPDEPETRLRDQLRATIAKATGQEVTASGDELAREGSASGMNPEKGAAQ